MSNWNLYEAEGNNFVDIGRWGKDHWSTLAYLECRAVDNKGMINNLQMRCDSRLHRHFAHVETMGMTDGGKYPTLLQGGIKLEKHDDWSCLEDMVEENLLKVEFRGNAKFPNEIFGNMEARVELTDLGKQVSGMLRTHKASGGTFSTFDLTSDEITGSPPIR